MRAWHLAELPERRAEQDPGSLCIEDSARKLDAEGFAREVESAAGRLAEAGVRRGHVVATILSNRIELVTTFFAAWRIGAAVTPVNPALTGDEKAYQLADSSASLAIVAEEDMGCELVVPAITANELVQGHDATERIGFSMKDLALIIYTSGTTGKPKGVLLDHGNLAAMNEMMISALELKPSDRALLVLPLFHVNGIMVSVVGPLSAGGSSVISQFQLKSFWAEVESYRPTYFSAVPTIYLLLNALPEGVHPDVSSVRFAICGAAPMPPNAITEFESRYSIPVLEGYGLSEATVASTLNPLRGPRKLGTVGLPLEGQQVRIQGNDGSFLEAGFVGEVVIQGPNVMRGYLNRPEDTEQALQGGWLHTGDVGYLDKDGYLVLVDRKKDMIIWGGENIYPKEIEAVIHGHPAVLEAAVVGRSNPIYGEEPVAFVTLRPGASADPAELSEYCSARLARFKVPREITILDALPKNSVGKITKEALRNR